MTLTTTEELKHLASSDNANELTRRLARECLANREAVPVAEYGDAYQGAREDLAIWKRRALEAEDKARHLERVNDHLVKEAQGEHRFGEPIITAPPAPVPAVPEEGTPDSIEILASARRRDHAVFQWDEDQRNAAADSWNACRAAMLAQPVSGGYKLVPAEPTEDMIAAAMNCDDVSFNADETFCVNFGNIYAAMLAAAPEGGNDHNTGR